MSLSAKAWFALVLLALAMGLLLFATAGTVRYWQAWVYLSIFFGASALITLFLARKDPALLARRMTGGPTAERRVTQKVIMLGASLGFIGLHVVPALDYRYQGTVVPLFVVLAGDALVAIGFYLTFLVYSANTFTSATIEIAVDQVVVSTGPYAVVRHPMYASAFLSLAGTPLALGSYWGVIPLAGMLPFLVWRLLDEERFLEASLPGYTEYQQTVRHRLVPRIW